MISLAFHRKFLTFEGGGGGGNMEDKFYFLPTARNSLTDAFAAVSYSCGTQVAAKGVL